MATAEQIVRLRLLVDEPDESTYADADLSDRLDAAGDINALARDLWTEKAARFAALVDITEGGSSRKNSALQAQALKMQGLFAGMATDDTSTSTGGVRIRRIRRP